MINIEEHIFQKIKHFKNKVNVDKYIFTFGTNSINVFIKLYKFNSDINKFSFEGEVIGNINIWKDTFKLWLEFEYKNKNKIINEFLNDSDLNDIIDNKKKNSYNVTKLYIDN